VALSSAFATVREVQPPLQETAAVAKVSP